MENFLLRLAKMYLQLNKYNKVLHWFQEQEGHFLVALGADGAPFGKDETATSFVVSFLNVLDGIQSCDNNFLLMGANCDETHELMFAYSEHVFDEMEKIEDKTYEVEGTQVTFKCKLIPSDQKWIAAMAGELNNAATYPSSFGNVCMGNMSVIGGSLGNEKNSTWKPWNFEQRLKDTKAVNLFKQKNKIPADTKDKGVRKKITTFIASIKSRQEREPYIGKFVDLVKPEPLHNTNNAWQAWNVHVLNTAVKLTNLSDINRANGNIDNLSQDTPLYKYVLCLENTFKAGRLVKNLRKWFRERKNNEMFSYRFTGKESKLFSWYFMHLCRALQNSSGIDMNNLLHVSAIAYSGLCLRNSVALYSRVHINASDLISLKEHSEQYFNCQSLLLSSCKPTTWTIGKAVPYHTSQLYSDLGFGLGLNSMQGICHILLLNNITVK